MISKETLDRIREQLEPEDRTPYEGLYTVSHTIYGCSSLSRGGTYYDQVNNHHLSAAISDKKLQGIYERNDYPGVFSIVFNPEKIDEQSAKTLISFLEDVNMNAKTSVPCIDENLAYDLEYDDVLDAITEELDDIIFHDEGRFPKGFEADRSTASYLLMLIPDSYDCFATVEQGPSIFIDSEKFAPYADILIHHINGRQERFDTIVSKLSEWTLQKGYASYGPDDDDSIFSIEMPVIRDRLWVKCELRLNHIKARIEATLSKLTIEEQYEYMDLTYPLSDEETENPEEIISRIKTDLDIAKATAENFRR